MKPNGEQINVDMEWIDELSIFHLDSLLHFLIAAVFYAYLSPVVCDDKNRGQKNKK